jgi:hypothetical protein
MLAPAPFETQKSYFFLIFSNPLNYPLNSQVPTRGAECVNTTYALTDNEKVRVPISVKTKKPKTSDTRGLGENFFFFLEARTDFARYHFYPDLWFDLDIHPTIYIYHIQGEGPTGECGCWGLFEQKKKRKKVRSRLRAKKARGFGATGFLCLGGTSCTHTHTQPWLRNHSPLWLLVNYLISSSNSCHSFLKAPRTMLSYVVGVPFETAQKDCWQLLLPDLEGLPDSDMAFYAMIIHCCDVTSGQSSSTGTEPLEIFATRKKREREFFRQFSNPPFYCGLQSLDARLVIE